MPPIGRSVTHLLSPRLPSERKAKWFGQSWLVRTITVDSLGCGAFCAYGKPDGGEDGSAQGQFLVESVTKTEENHEISATSIKGGVAGGVTLDVHTWEAAEERV